MKGLWRGERDKSGGEEGDEEENGGVKEEEEGHEGEEGAEEAPREGCPGEFVLRDEGECSSEDGGILDLRVRAPRASDRKSVV